jgi:hypothetical protein
MAAGCITTPTRALVAGERAAGLLSRGQSWLIEHAAWLRVWLSTGIGVALLVDGLVRLVR